MHLRELQRANIKTFAHLNMCCVVTTSHVTIMIYYGIKFIQMLHRIPFASYVICQVKVMDGKVDECLQLMLC